MGRRDDVDDFFGEVSWEEPAPRRREPRVGREEPPRPRRRAAPEAAPADEGGSSEELTPRAPLPRRERARRRAAARRKGAPVRERAPAPARPPAARDEGAPGRRPAARREGAPVRRRGRRPTRRTFLIRRLTALACLIALVSGITAGVRALGGGDLPSPVAPRDEPVATAPPPARPSGPATALDALVRADRTLALGDRGNAVRRLQQSLAVLGLSAGAADGVFGEQTRQAIMAFENARGLAPGGSLTRPTADALRAALADWAGGQFPRVRRGLADAVAAKRLSRRAAARHRAVLDDTAYRMARMPADRRALVTTMLQQLAVHAPMYDEPRALTLFAMLDANARWLARRRLPRAGSDIEGRDGTVYRSFAGKGLQFHPLANFVQLNRYAAVKNRDKVQRLAAAIRARAVRARGGGRVWEYYFAFGGPPRWTSALAQSAAAQALARGGTLLDDERTAGLGRSAFEAIPGPLARPLAGGTWVREYSWSDIAILNAQLQSAVSLMEYAELTEDRRATSFTKELTVAARSALPRLDTGSWSLYAIDGRPASEHYHCYHVLLLEQLARRETHATWSRTADRWERYAAARGGCED